MSRSHIITATRPASDPAAAADGAILQTWGGRHAGIQAPTLATASGTMRMALARSLLYQGITVSTLGFVTGTTAAVGPTNWWMALYDGDRNLLAQTADQGAAAIAANTAYALALSSAYTASVDTRVYLAWCAAVTTTMPSLLTVVASAVANAVAPVSNGTSTTGLGGKPPNPAAAITTIAQVPYFWAA